MATRRQPFRRRTALSGLVNTGQNTRLSTALETFAIEMETQLDVFLRRQYPNENGN